MGMGAHSDPGREHRENKSQASKALLHQPQLLLAGMKSQEGFLPSFLPHSGALTLAGCQVPTKAAPSLPSPAGQGTGNRMKGS